MVQVQVVKAKLTDTLEEVETYKSEIKQLNDIISHADEILKKKEKEILWLHDLVQKNQLEIKVNMIIIHKYYISFD